MFIIRNTNNRNIYWSNEWGWVDTEGEYGEFEISLFDNKDYNLPLEGEWISI